MLWYPSADGDYHLFVNLYCFFVRLCFLRKVFFLSKVFSFFSNHHVFHNMYSESEHDGSGVHERRAR